VTQKLEYHMNGIPLQLQATILAPEQALMINPFDLHMNGPLTSEAAGLHARLEPAGWPVETAIG
jgi:hypothetical protein